MTDLKAIKKLLDDGRANVNQGHLKDAPYWLDAIEELLSMIAPRPIETAPRDRTPIIAYDPELGWHEVWWNGHEWASEDADVDAMYEPTHWIPRPPKP